jgi:hypothetical protein
VAIITLRFDGRKEVRVDEEEFEILKLMVEEFENSGEIQWLRRLIQELEKQGYEHFRAQELAILAKREVFAARA